MEDFGYLKDDNNKSSVIIKKAAMIGATLFSVSCFIYVTISAYNFIRMDEKNRVIEVIKSPEEPIKVVEEYKYDEINNQNNGIKIDKEIYEDIFGNKKETLASNPKHILMQEEPASPPIIDQQFQDEEELEDLQDQKIAKSQSTGSKITKAQTTKQQTLIAQTNDQNNKIIVFSQNNEQNKNSQTLLNQRNQLNTDNNHKKRTVRVQVAAFNSKKLSKEYWQKINHDYNNLLSGLKYYIEEANLGKKGIFYRLQIGNFINQIEAENFCNRFVLQAKKTRSDCIIVE
jgi:hypothetical protein